MPDIEEPLTPSADRSLPHSLPSSAASSPPPITDSHPLYPRRPSLSVHQPVRSPTGTPHHAHHFPRDHSHHHHNHRHHHDHEHGAHPHSHSRSFPSPGRGPSLFHIPPPQQFLPLQPDIYPYLGRHRELPTLISRTSTGLSGGLSAAFDVERNLSQRRKSRVESSLNRLALEGEEVERGERLIGDAGFGWNWDDYKVDDDAIAGRSKGVKQFYEKQNKLIELYEYVDKLLDSPLARTLLDSYKPDDESPSDTASSQTITSPLAAVRSYGTTGTSGTAGDDEGETSSSTETGGGSATETTPLKPGPAAGTGQGKKVRRRPSYLYRIADEESPLMGGREAETAEEKNRIVRVAIYVNLLANLGLLVAKGVITVLTSSLSVIASLVDSVMDMLSTLIIWATSHLVQNSSSGDSMRYPVGRSRLEPIGVLIFSIIMITSFVQVGIEGIQRLISPDKEIVVLTPWAIGIMASTVAIKGVLWLWCRLVKNSSVQALAADAFTDVVFNTLSILFPLLGTSLSLPWLDAAGGIFLSLFVILQWGSISATHIKNLTGGSASPELKSVLLYLVMRFAKGIKQVTAINCYHAGDRINVEVDIVLDESMGLRDAHDLGEVLQWVIEALPVVERAWVHADYDRFNPIGHLR